MFVLLFKKHNNQMELIFEKKFITPDIANEMLQKNTGNRRLRVHTVAFYRDQMERGQWRQDTAEPIKISPTGRILDGQHRLAALISYGKGLYFHLALNVPEENFQVLDTGLKRGSADSLYTMGIENATATSGAIKNWFLIKRKQSTDRSNMRAGITNEDIIKEYLNRREFWTYIVKNGTNYYRKFNHIIPPSLLMGWYSVFSDIDMDKADLFMQKLCLGIGNQSEKDTVGQLRNILQKNVMNRLKMTTYTRAGFITKSWNYFFRDKEIAFLRFDEFKDEFPILDVGGDEPRNDSGYKRVRGTYKKQTLN